MRPRGAEAMPAGVRRPAGDEEEDVVERVRPRGDPEAAQEEEHAECQPGEEAEEEGGQRPRVAVGPDVVEGGEEDRREEGREGARASAPQAAAAEDAEEAAHQEHAEERAPRRCPRRARARRPRAGRARDRRPPAARRTGSPRSTHCVAVPTTAAERQRVDDALQRHAQEGRGAQGHPARGAAPPRSAPRPPPAAAPLKASVPRTPPPASSVRSSTSAPLRSAGSPAARQHRRPRLVEQEQRDREEQGVGVGAGEAEIVAHGGKVPAGRARGQRRGLWPPACTAATPETLDARPAALPRLPAPAAVLCPLAGAGGCGLIGRPPPPSTARQDARIRQEVQRPSFGSRASCRAPSAWRSTAGPSCSTAACAASAPGSAPCSNAELVPGVSSVVDYLVLERGPRDAPCLAPPATP